MRPTNERKSFLISASLHYTPPTCIPRIRTQDFDATSGWWRRRGLVSSGYSGNGFSKAGDKNRGGCAFLAFNERRRQHQATLNLNPEFFYLGLGLTQFAKIGVRVSNVVWEPMVLEAGNSGMEFKWLRIQSCLCTFDCYYCPCQWLVSTGDNGLCAFVIISVMTDQVLQTGSIITPRPAVTTRKLKGCRLSMRECILGDARTEAESLILWWKSSKKLS